MHSNIVMQSAVSVVNMTRSGLNARPAIESIHSTFSGKSWVYSCWCFVRRESESPLPPVHDDYVNRDALRDYANRDSFGDDYADDYANREAIREARDRERERERERQANEYREYVNAPSTWQQDSGDDNRNTQRRQTNRGQSFILYFN